MHAADGGKDIARRAAELCGVALVLVEDRDAGFGYVDRFGHVVIECQYDWATPFVEGVAQVGKWIDDDYYEYYIDTTGNEINLMMN